MRRSKEREMEGEMWQKEVKLELQKEKLREKRETAVLEGGFLKYPAHESCGCG